MENAESTPKLTRLDVESRSNPQRARTRLRWAVSDPAGTLESVTSFLIRTKSGEAADSRTSSASGSSASRRHNLRNRREHGEYEVSLTVTTANGKFTFSLRKLALENQIRRDC